MPFLLSSALPCSYSSTLLLLSLSFATLKKEKINFTAPSPSQSGTLQIFLVSSLSTCSKKEGPKSISWPLLPFYSPGPSPKERHTSSFCFCSAGLSLKASQSISIQVVSFVSFWGTLLLCILPMCPLWKPASGGIVNGPRVVKGHLR